jgi:hypothetical protein
MRVGTEEGGREDLEEGREGGKEEEERPSFFAYVLKCCGFYSGCSDW